MTRKCPLRWHILAPLEGLHAPVGTRGRPQESGLIPRRFKQKKNFCEGQTNERRTDGWTDRRDSRNSVVDVDIFTCKKSRCFYSITVRF